MFGDDEPETLTLPVSLGTLDRFGDYELLGEIARGGMGVVYRARQVSLNRMVALKLLRDGALASAGEAERFRVEATAAAGLRHPHIVAVHEIGEHEGQQFFSMDLVEGRNLADLTRDGPLPARMAATLVSQVAEAIQHAHERGILHRDLKPSNVLVDAQGAAQVTDFGLARQTNQDSGLTLTGQVLGTPGYMAPEQAAGRNRDVNVTSDTYALGAVLYHLITGRAPFMGESPAAVLRQVEEQEPVSPRLLNPSVPRDLETVTLKALNKDPARRYATASELAEDLGRFLRGEPVRARPIGRAERGWRWCRRNPALALSGAFSVVLLMAVVAVVTASSIRLAAQRREAEQVKGFLQEILAAPDPTVGGREVRVIDILDRARRRATNELSGAPLVLAEVQTTLGNTYYQLSMYDEAEPLLRSALEIYERELGPDSLEAAEVKFAMGSLLTWKGDSPGGLEYLQLAEAAFRRNPKAPPHLLANALGEIGSALVSAGRTREALLPSRECIERCEQLGPSQDAVRASALGDLSTALWDLDDPEWRRYLEQSIEINRRLPDGKVNLATSLSNLADGYLEEGDTTRAEQASRESLELRKELFGTNSSPVAFALARLGTVFLAQSNYPAALAVAEQAEQMDATLLPPDHRDVQFILRLQGRALNLLNRPQEAEPILRRAQEIAKKAYGDDHLTVHGIGGILAESLVAQNRKSEALVILEAALPVMRAGVESRPAGSLQRKRLAEFETLTESVRRSVADSPAESVR